VCRENQTLKNSYAFTLVELIVVITILAILGMIGFVSIQGYSRSARDSVRVSDVRNIVQAVDTIITERWSAPIPTNSVTYTGWLITIQSGIVTGAAIPRLSAWIKDPSTQKPYSYSILWNGIYYQVWVNLENTTLLLSWAQGSEAPITDPIAPVSKIVWSYAFNPALPSLFPIAGTIVTASGGLFSPDACFTLSNIATNTLNSTSSECIKRKDLVMQNIDRGLLAYWDMETLSWGLLRDMSGNGYNWVFSGGTYASSLTGGVLGKWLNFNGQTNSGYFIEIPKIPEQTTPSFSILTTIRPDSFSGGYPIPYSGIWWYYWTGSNNCHLEFVDNTQLRIRLGNVSKSTIPFPQIDTFVQLGVSYNGKSLSVYINWKRVDEIIGDVWTIFWTWPDALFQSIGNSNVSPTIARPFRGIIDDLQLYNRALSENEIRQQVRIMR
jgi:prepilin-type N-terminal cleavage/methylation domain-containing protein